MKLSHADRFNIGDTIRAYEFQPCAGRNDCYHEGKIVETCNKEHGYDAYIIEVTRHVFDGEVTSFRNGCRVMVPHMIMFREYAHRIISL
jgi:hypothetical protein